MLEDVEQIVAFSDIESLWAYLSKAIAGYGFTRLIYGYTCHRTGNHLGDRRDLLILTTLPESYVERFIEGDLWYDAPMVRWGLSNTGANPWNWVAERAARGELTEGEQRVFAFNQSQNLTVGYSLSFPKSSLRAAGGIGLGAPEGMSQREADAIWKAHGRDLWALCNIAHLKIIDLPHTGGRRALTPRQREALEWVADGKTTQDIATIMGLTAATVEKHLRLARETLSVETTAQAVMKASVQNQIFLFETVSTTPDGSNPRLP